MRTFQMVVFGLLATAALFLPGVVVPMFAGSAEDETVAAVLAAEQAREAALLAADTHALGKLLADDLRYTHSDGNLETKAIHIATITNGLRYARFTTANVVGHVITPEVVVLTGVLDQRKGYGEKWKDAHLMFHAVWRKKSGAWQLASLQTAAPPAANH